MTNWAEATVLDLADGKRDLFNDGDWIEAPSITTSGNRLLQTGNVGVGRLRDRGTKRYVSDESFRSLRCKEVVPGDILICRLADPAGRACLVHDIGEKRMLTSVDVTIYRPNPQKADRRFLVAMLSMPAWFREVNERCGGSTRTRIARSELGKIQLLIPPIEEQVRIADALADIDDSIATLECLIAKKQAIKQGMMQQLLTGRTRLPGFSDNWLDSTLGAIARVTGGGTPSTRVSSFWGGGIPWFTPAEIKSQGSGLVSSSERTITQEGLASSAATLLPAGTVLVTSRASIGNCAVAAVPVSTNQGFTSMIPKDSRSTWFLYYWIQQYRSELESRAAGSTFLEISASKVAAISLRQPNLDEQAAIGTAIRDADAELDTLNSRLTKARAIKSGMMQQLLTGRTRLPVEVAS
ncbi:restriction endonuclease subunit S [Nocardia thailandica]